MCLWILTTAEVIIGIGRAAMVLNLVCRLQAIIDVHSRKIVLIQSRYSINGVRHAGGALGGDHRDDRPGAMQRGFHFHLDSAPFPR